MTNTAPLYQIATDFNDAFAAITNMELSHEELQDSLAAIEGEFKDKAVNVGIVIKNMDADIDQVDAAIKNLQERKRILSNRRSNLAQYLCGCMEATGLTKIPSPLFDLSLRKGVEVAIIENEDDLPDDLVDVKTTITPKKREILAKLKAGEAVPGARKERNPSTLTIK